jgi:hypothetical protein
MKNLETKIMLENEKNQVKTQQMIIDLQKQMMTTIKWYIGGAGVVIVSYQYPSQRGSGGTVTSYTSGGFTYWVHTFTSSGTFVA